MSTPFPLEEQSQTADNQDGWYPWDQPAQPHWYSGLGYSEDNAYLGPLVASAGSAAAKGELLLSGLLRSSYSGAQVSAPHLSADEAAEDARQTAQMSRWADNVESDAKMRLRALKPDAQTTGVAAQTLHGLGEGLSTLAVSGPAGLPGAVAALSSTQGYAAYRELLDQGVAPSTAATVGSLRGALAGAGAVVPMTWGSSLISQVGTGILSNVGFGVAGRAADSQILRRAGYGEMADQEAPFDTTQLLVDAVLGAGFGGFAHLHEALNPQAQAALSSDSAARDAALLTNLSLRDRAGSPGVPVTPAGSAAHAAALEKALQDLQDGQRVNIADTGIADATTVARNGEPNPVVSDLLRTSLRESGLLEQEQMANALEAALDRRLQGAEPVKTPLTDADLQRLPDDLARTKMTAQYEAASEALPDFNATLRSIASETGAEPQIRDDLKAPARAVEKAIADYNGDPARVTDLLRGSLVARDAAHVAQVADAVRHHFDVISEKDRFSRPVDGYRDLMLKVRAVNGHVSEVQVHLPEMLKAKKDMHPLYEEARSLDAVSDLSGEQLQRLRELNRQMRDGYELAWERSTRSSNSSADAVTPLRLTEPNVKGRGGEVSNARMEAPPPSEGIKATGTSSTSKNSEPLGKEAEVRGAREGEVSPLGRDASLDMSIPPTGSIHQLEYGAAMHALRENPNLELPDDQGTTVRADELLQRSDQQMAQAEQEAPNMFKAAVDCFLGGGT